MKLLNKVLLIPTFAWLTVLNAQANMFTILEDDGSGFNPVTATQNNWIIDDPNVWTIGGTVQDLANNPTFSGSDAANDMIAQLGGSNQIITANVLGAGTNTMSLDPIQFTPIGGSPRELTFSQSVMDDTSLDSNGNESNTAFIFDNMRIDIDSVINDGFSVWLWMDMFIIKEVLLEVMVEVQRIQVIHKDKSIVTTTIEVELVKQIQFISMGSLHFHATFDQNQTSVDLPSEALIYAAPEPSTSILLVLGLTALFWKRR